MNYIIKINYEKHNMPPFIFSYMEVEMICGLHLFLTSNMLPTHNHLD